MISYMEELSLASCGSGELLATGAMVKIFKSAIF